VAKRDPHEVLGVGRGASATEIKAAWRRLARAHHPDLTGDDPALSRVATRQMAEINDAYAALTRDAAGRSAADRAGEPATFDEDARPKRGGPPRPKPTPPVTGRVDMSATYRARNQAAAHGAPRTTLPGQPPPRPESVGGEPPRASTPTGPLIKDRVRHFRRRPPPPLEEANVYPVEFGKFHGHTLGQIASFEPSYIDWLSGTVTRDPELVAAARVVQADLDRRGILRRARQPPEPVARPGRSA
jgi:curved DNA-binding protein CbpA